MIPRPDEREGAMSESEKLAEWDAFERRQEARQHSAPKTCLDCGDLIPWVRVHAGRLCVWCRRWRVLDMLTAGVS